MRLARHEQAATRLFHAHVAVDRDAVVLRLFARRHVYLQRSKTLLRKAVFELRKLHVSFGGISSLAD